MKTLSRRLIRRLWIALGVMLLGLLGLIVIVHVATLQMGEMNRIVVADTAPGVVALHGMGRDATRLKVLLRAALSPTADVSALETPIAEARGALAANAQAWFALPLDPGEAELMAAAKAGIARLDDLAHRILSTSRPMPSPMREAFLAELDAAAGDLDGVIARASDLNASLASHASREAEGVGQRLLPAAIGIEAASLLLAAFALVAGYRVSRSEAAMAERRLLEQKNAELEAFSGRVAHDVLSPLMAVSLAVGVAEQRLSAPADARVHEMLDRASRSLQRVRQVVSDLLEFARAAAPPVGAETEVAPLLQSLVHDLEPVAEEAGVDLRLTGAPPVRVRCAAGVLSSIVTNLVQNAIRHADKDEHRVDVRAVDSGEEVRLEVEDTGPGVPPEERERIFEPYVRATDKGVGLGLGLATVKRLAESHGGHVGVCSPEGRGHGALFWVTLPPAAPHAG